VKHASIEAKEADMGCWHGHGYGHGCGPGYDWPSPRGWYGPADERDWYADMDRRSRRRFLERADEGGSREAALEARLDDLRDELRRVEAALADLQGPASVGTPG
jgi:hypothetical protein